MKIKFAVYLNDDYFEWQEVYLNNKKLSEEEAEEYQIYVEENSVGFLERTRLFGKEESCKVLLLFIGSAILIKIL